MLLEDIWKFGLSLSLALGPSLFVFLFISLERRPSVVFVSALLRALQMLVHVWTLRSPRW